MTEEEQKTEAEAKEEAATEVEDVEALKKSLEEAEAKAAANLAGWQRAQADFINYKRRCEQEKEESARYAGAGVITSLLPILDDFERALGAVPPELAGQGWVEGFRLIQRKYQSCLEVQGVVPIKAEGEQFDPKLHEAIKEVFGKDGLIIQEVQKGYRLGDRVLRPSKVIVGGSKPQEPEAGHSGNKEVIGEENKPCQEP